MTLNLEKCPILYDTTISQILRKNHPMKAIEILERAIQQQVSTFGTKSAESIIKEIFKESSIRVEQLLSLKAFPMVTELLKRLDNIVMRYTFDNR